MMRGCSVFEEYLIIINIYVFANVVLSHYISTGVLYIEAIIYLHLFQNGNLSFHCCNLGKQHGLQKYGFGYDFFVL